MWYTAVLLPEVIMFFQLTESKNVYYLSPIQLVMIAGLKPNSELGYWFAKYNGYPNLLETLHAGLLNIIIIIKQS